MTANLEPMTLTPADGAVAIDASPPASESVGGRQPGRRMFGLGMLMIVLGLVAIAHGGVALIAIGALLSARRTYALIIASRVRSGDRTAAAAFQARLASGALPPAVEPLTLHREGVDLDPSEVCYLDGAPVEILSFYGDPYVKQSVMAVFFGGPLAWFATITAWLLVHEANKRRARRAKPYWRDPAAAQLWVTSRRLMLHGLAGNRSWVQLRFEHIVQADPENGGLVLSAVEGPRPLMKIRLAHPTSLCLLVDRLIADDPRGRTDALSSRSIAA
jgi:hypothetical protein